MGIAPAVGSARTLAGRHCFQVPGVPATVQTNSPPSASHQNSANTCVTLVGASLQSINATATLRRPDCGGSGGADSGVVEKTGAPSSQASTVGSPSTEVGLAYSADQRNKGPG